MASSVVVIMPLFCSSCSSRAVGGGIFTRRQCTTKMEKYLCNTARLQPSYCAKILRSTISYLRSGRRCYITTFSKTFRWRNQRNLSKSTRVLQARLVQMRRRRFVKMQNLPTRPICPTNGESMRRLKATITCLTSSPCSSTSLSTIAQ